MRLLLAAGASLLILLCLAPADFSAAQTAPASGRRLTLRQTQQIARLVARHDRIDLTDTHVELNSMDLGADFIPGYSSFIVIRESSTPGPDETLRRYAVNRRTGDVWEMTLCTHYDFPELTRLRRTLALRTAPGAGDIASEGKELGCTDQKTAPAS
ncbi:MAG: effector immunity protein Tgi2PP [Acidobacteriaceae bacterium]